LWRSAAPDHLKQPVKLRSFGPLALRFGLPGLLGGRLGAKSSQDTISKGENWRLNISFFMGPLSIFPDGEN
jgi:hypothetical protein